jgi:uncharacterized damage-inducible protein DinB
MNLPDIQLLYEYHSWANKQILNACKRITAEQYTTPAMPNPGHGNLRGTLVHTYDTDYGWRMLVQAGTSTDVITEQDLPTLDDLITRWQDEEQAMRAYLNNLDDQVLNGMVRYTVNEGEYRERVLWHCLLHVVNHATQHRSEAAAMLTGYGQSPGELDFTVFLWE